MGVRQRSCHPNSSIAEQELRFVFANLAAAGTAEVAESVFLHDVERVEITEVGASLSALAGGNLDLEARWGNDALSPSDPNTGTLAYSTATAGGTPYRFTLANTSKSKRFYSDGQDNPVINAPVETVVAGAKRGVMLKLVASALAGVTDADGVAWMRYRAFRREDL